eukprot:1938122-Rhodomonas_salina.1
MSHPDQSYRLNVFDIAMHNGRILDQCPAMQRQRLLSDTLHYVQSTSSTETYITTGQQWTGNLSMLPHFKRGAAFTRSLTHHIGGVIYLTDLVTQPLLSPPPLQG